MKIVADDKIPYLEGVIEPFAQVMYKSGQGISNQDVRDADGLIVRTRTKCNGKLLNGSSVKFIASATIGFDHIDTEYCREQNITWTNAPGCNSSSVQQYIASVLATLDRLKLRIQENPVLGIVGVGNVGSKVDKLARLLGMEVMLNDPPRKRQEGGNQWSTLKEIIDKAGIITFHVPLNMEGIDRTYHMVDREFLSQLHPDTILINTSRGEVFDNQALKDALKGRQILAAVLDVWENEPEIDPELLDLVTLGTPHIAGYSKDGKANGTAQSVRSLSRFFGFGMDEWYPTNIEPPENPVIRIRSARSLRKIMFEAILSTYDISKDDKRFRQKPEQFEKQRGNYPVRREFGAYQVELDEDHQGELPQTMQKLGFHLARVHNSRIK